MGFEWTVSGYQFKHIWCCFLCSVLFLICKPKKGKKASTGFGNKKFLNKNWYNSPVCSKDKLSANSKVTWLMLQAHASGITKITASVCTELAFEIIALKTLRTRFVSIQSQLPSSKHLDNKSAKDRSSAFRWRLNWVKLTITCKSSSWYRNQLW